MWFNSDVSDINYILQGESLLQLVSIDINGTNLIKFSQDHSRGHRSIFKITFTDLQPLQDRTLHFFVKLRDFILNKLFFDDFVLLVCKLFF